LRKIEIINIFYVDVLNYYARILLIFSKLCLELFGHEVVTYGKTIKIIDNFHTSGVFLDRGCMGRNVLLAFSVMILALPGPFKHKLWYLPSGLIILTFVNVLRISGLAYINKCCPDYSDINHYLFFKLAAWTVIFILWYVWIKKFSLKYMKNKLRKN